MPSKFSILSQLARSVGRLLELSFELAFGLLVVRVASFVLFVSLFAFVLARSSSLPMSPEHVTIMWA